MTRPAVGFFFVLIFVYCSLSVAYLFLLAFWGKLFFKRKKWSFPGDEPVKRIAILVPAYKEDEVIYFTATSLLYLDYPRELYDIYIIADSFEAGTLLDLAKLPLHVLEVSFDNSTKVKSLNEAFKRIDKAYDIALICDGDNMLNRDFLKKINNAFMNGAKAIQGKRVAKNLDTSFAILDACSEAISHHIFRKGANALGLSSAICGSGMAFEFITVRHILSGIDAVGGFDKILQMEVLQQNIFIHYLDNALVYDEKVDSPKVFAQQRKRWISSQFIHSQKFFFPAFRELFKGNISYFNLAIANYCILPKAFFLVILPPLAAVGFYLGNNWGIAAMGLFLIYIISLSIALPPALINRDLLRAVLTLPRAISLLVRASFQFKRSGENFIHTPHTKTGITNAGAPD
jgi:cellulose synthase/poly-beta-1,6-N-acetylglucosamine synthase-like glycosyltransferase